MVDRELRKQLSQDLRRLVTGRMTNDAFDDAYYENYFRSSDNVVREVAEFGWGLYSSDLLFPYRLRGRHAIDGATRRVAARCVLLLRTDRQYEWSDCPNMLTAQILWALAFNLGLPGGVALLICSVPALLLGEPDLELFVLIALCGGFALAASVWYLFRRSGFAGEYDLPDWRAWRQSGDFDVWPFHRREDFYAARRSDYLLGVADSPPESD